MTKQISLEDRLTIPEEVVFEKLGDEAVLLHLESSVYYGLDPVGSRMWELLVAFGNPQDVLQKMEAEYDVEPDVLQRDVKQLLQELLEQGLITTQSVS